MKTPSHLTASFFYTTLGIPEKTFYNRVVSKGVNYIQQWGGTRQYDVKDWNKKNPDHKMPKELPID